MQLCMPSRANTSAALCLVRQMRLFENEWQQRPPCGSHSVNIPILCGALMK